jgi:hypothetical protein
MEKYQKWEGLTVMKVIRDGKEWLIIKKIRDRKGIPFRKEIIDGNTLCSKRDKNC